MATAGAAEPALGWTALAGLQSSFGIPITALDSPHEPATKLAIPVEVSFGATLGPGVWLRAHVGAGVLLNGTYLLSTGAGELVGFPHHVDLLASAGFTRSGLAAGALGGFEYPSRPAVRGYAGWSQPDGPLAVELRCGVNLPTERPVEPVLQVLFGVHGPIGGRD